jgi:hypothetical protein
MLYELGTVRARSIYSINPLSWAKVQCFVKNWACQLTVNILGSLCRFKQWQGFYFLKMCGEQSYSHERNCWGLAECICQNNFGGRIKPDQPGTNKNVGLPGFQASRSVALLLV